MEERNASIVAAIPSIENTCQIEYLQQRTYSQDFNDTFSDWQAILASYLPRGIEFERVGLTIRCLFSILPAQRVSQSALRIPLAVSCSITSKNISCIVTFSRVTACFITPPVAG